MGGWVGGGEGGEGKVVEGPEEADGVPALPTEGREVAFVLVQGQGEGGAQGLGDLDQVGVEV